MCVRFMWMVASLGLITLIMKNTPSWTEKLHESFALYMLAVFAFPCLVGLLRDFPVVVFGSHGNEFILHLSNLKEVK